MKYSAFVVNLLDRLATVALTFVVVGGIGAIYFFKPFTQEGVSEPEPPFYCALRRMMLLELETLHEQRIVASLEHRGVVLELRENPHPNRGDFSLLWTRRTGPELSGEMSSCVIVSGVDWTRPNGSPFLVDIDYDPFAE